MSSVNLTEVVVTTIIEYLKTTMPTALADVRTERVESSVNTEIPKEYFNYVPAHGFRCPAIAMVADNIDFHLERGQNFVSAIMTGVCSVCVEDKTQDNLVKKSWRYQDALFSTLNRQSFDVNGVKFVIKIVRCRYSNDGIMKNDGVAQSVFQKEVALDLEIEVYQND